MADWLNDWLVNVALFFSTSLMAGGMTAEGLSERYGRAVKRAILVAVCWLVVMIFVACMSTPETIALVIPLYAVFVPLAVFLAAVAVTNPHMFTAGTAAAMLPYARSHAIRPAISLLAKIIGFDLALAIYLSLVPVCRNVALVPVLLLFGLALFFFPKKAKWVAVIGIAAITIVMFHGGGYLTKAKKGMKEMSSSLNISTTPEDYYGGKRPGTDVNLTAAPDQPEYKSFDIPLHPDGYNDHYWIPKFWGSYSLAFSGEKSSDWVSVFCAGHDTAGSIHRGNEANTKLVRDMVNCHNPNDQTDNFWPQGTEGTFLTVTVIRKKSRPTSHS